MYALVHKNRVLAGPMAWNRAIFDGNLNKLGIKFTLPKAAPESLPLIIDQDTAVYPVEFDYPEYNAKIHYLEGPYWTFVDGVARAGYLVKDQSVDSVKYNLKQKIAEERWKLEVAGTTTTIQGQTVSVDTDRGSRDIFVQKFILMDDTATVRWKFPEAWLTLSKTELGQVVQAGAAHVESAFAWESQKSGEIDSAQTLEELDQITLTPPSDN